MSEPRILVIGEKFIDRYWIGTATRLSPEAPIPVVAVKEVIQSAGGAGNVYANLETLGATVELITSMGSLPVKNRLIANGEQIARWDENDHMLEISVWQELFTNLDAVVISDYGKQAFNSQNIADITKFSKDLPIFIDTKDVRLWPRQNTFFFPNLKEWTAQKTEYNLCPNVVRTESENGMTYLQYGEARWHVPTQVKEIVSVCGAGDTAIAAFAYNYCIDRHIIGAMKFASKACAVVCGKSYTAVASHEEINKIKR